MPAKFSTFLHFWYSATPLQISFWNEMYWLISQAEFCETPCYIPLSFDNIIFLKLYFQLPPKLSSVLFLFPFLVTSFSDNISHSVSELFVKSQYHINKSSLKKVNFVNWNVSDFFFGIHGMFSWLLFTMIDICLVYLSFVSEITLWQRWDHIQRFTDTFLQDNCC